MRRRRIALIILLLLAVLIAVPVILTWRQVRQEWLNHALIAAVDRNDTNGVRLLLKQGADPNALALPDDTRSMWQHVWEIIRRRPTPPTGNQPSALMRAIAWIPQGKNHVTYNNGYIHSSPPVLGVDYQENVETIKALVDAGANVNVRGNDGDRSDWTTWPLVLAAEKGKWRSMRILLTRRPQINAVDSNGRTALTMTANDAKVGMVETLLRRGANVNAKSQDGETALSAAAGMAFMSRSTKLQNTIECLLRYGAKVNVRDYDHETPLMHAAPYDAEIVRLLLEHGAEVNQRDNEGNTALHSILLQRAVGPDVNIDSLRQLLAHGADPNLANQYGNTALMLAQQRNRPDIVALLRQAGAK